MATHPKWEHAPEVSRRYIRYGASPRGAQAMVLDGQGARLGGRAAYNVSLEDLKTVALPALRHRLILNFEGEAEGIDVDHLIEQVIESAEVASLVGKETFLR